MLTRSVKSTPPLQKSADAAGVCRKKRLSIDRSQRLSAPSERIRRFSELIRKNKIRSVARWRAKIRRKVKVPALVRFRRYAKLVLMCVRLCRSSHERVDSFKTEFLSVIQYSQDLAKIDKDGLFFDPSEYKASKQERLPNEARKILQLRPESRTEKELKYLQIVLRSIKAFAEYPTKMQKRLCQVAWFEAYEPSRAIVRQHHPPHSFYFILCGTVIVTAFDKKNSETRYLVSLYRGMSFGELAVITRSRRQATVSTQTYTELLCISSQDFEDIFMAGGVKNVNDPDHNAFLEKVRFLRHWPVHLLAQNPQACMFHYFNRGEILVRDSNKSDWIYIVKSGSLSVLKKLKEVHPENDKDNSTEEQQVLDSDEEDESKSRNSFGTWQYRMRAKRQKRLLKYRPVTDVTPEVYKNNYEMERRLEQTLPGYFNTNDRLGILDYPTIITEHRSRLLKNQENDKLPKLVNEEDTKSQSDDISMEEEKTFKLPQIRKTSKGAYLASNSTRRKSSIKPLQNVQEELARKQLELQKKMSNKEEGRKTISNEFDNRPPSRIILTEADLHPMFTLIQVLEKGQYFGISTTIYPDQPSLSVVSNGAECIMISKKFFMEKKTDATMRSLHQTENPFPNDEALQKKLQNYVNWESHRKRIYNRLVERYVGKRGRQNQYLRQYGGQYCFRTGPI